MSASIRVPAGVPSGGQFAASAHAEATGVALTVTVPPTETAREQMAVAVAHVERLVARETKGGKVTEVDRQEDVESDLRRDYPHLSQERFDAHMAAIGTLAEQISAVEAAEDTDTEAYADAARDVNRDLADYPAEDWEPGDAHVDCAAFKAGVIEELDVRMHRAVRALVEEDATANRASAYSPIGRTA